MMVDERKECLKAMKYGFSDEAIMTESQLTADEVHEVRVEYERGNMCDATD